MSEKSCRARRQSSCQGCRRHGRDDGHREDSSDLRQRDSTEQDDEHERSATPRRSTRRHASMLASSLPRTSSLLDSRVNNSSSKRASIFFLRDRRRARNGRVENDQRKLQRSEYVKQDQSKSRHVADRANDLRSGEHCPGRGHQNQEAGRVGSAIDKQLRPARCRASSR